MQLEEIERQGLFLQRMDDSGEWWFRYHPLFGNQRQRCQWELAVELPEIAVRRPKAGWRKASRVKPFTTPWPRVTPTCCAIFCSTTHGDV